MSRLMYWLCFASILLVALVLRLGAAGYWQYQLEREGKVLRFGDSDSYWILAKRIANAEPYQYGGETSKIFRAPLYPLFLAPAVKIASSDVEPDRLSVMLGRGIGIVLGVVTVALVMILTRTLAFEEAGLAAGVLAAVYPGSIGMSVLLLSEALFCPLMLVSLGAAWLAFKATPNKFPWAWCAVSGVASGLACLTRPSWSLWGLLLAVYVFNLWNLQGRSLRDGLRLFCMLVLIATALALTMAPWWVRNYRITGKLVPTTLQVGASLYDGLHDGATGSSDEGMEFTRIFILAQELDDRIKTDAGQPLESTFEWRVDQKMRNASLAWAADHPRKAIQLAVAKLAKTWRPFPVAAEIGSGVVRASEGICYLLIAVLAAAGAWVMRKDLGSWLFLQPSLYFSLLHMVFIGSVRYRQPAVLVLCVLAGVGATAWIRSRTLKRVL